MILEKRFSLYACLIHGFIIFLFIFWGTSSEPEDRDNKIVKIVEIDVFTPENNAVQAESIVDEEIIDDILSNLNYQKTYTKQEKIAKAEEDERIRAKKAKEINRKKAEKARKIKQEKERIKRENKLIQDKLNADKIALDIKKKREQAERDLKKKKKEERIKRNEKRKQEQIAKNKKLISKKNLSKDEWLETPSGKADYNMYSNDLLNKVYSKWIKPFHSKTGWNCELEIHQDKNGRVKNIKNINCNPNNIELRNSVQKAVMQASPLPLPKDPRLFDKTVIFKFSVE